MTHQERAKDAEARGNWREAADIWHALLMNTPPDAHGSRGRILAAWRYAEAKAPPAEAPF